MTLQAGEKVQFKGPTFFEDRQWTPGVLQTGLISDPTPYVPYELLGKRGYRVRTVDGTVFVYAGMKNIRKFKKPNRPKVW